MLRVNPFLGRFSSSMELHTTKIVPYILTRFIRKLLYRVFPILHWDTFIVFLRKIFKETHKGLFQDWWNLCINFEKSYKNCWKTLIAVFINTSSRFQDQSFKYYLINYNRNCSINSSRVCSTKYIRNSSRNSIINFAS